MVEAGGDKREFDAIFYCLGGGMGHLTRGMAIARRLLGGGVSSVLLSSPRAFVPPCEDGIEIARVPDEVRLAQGAPEPLGRWLRGVVERFRPGVLVVDSFPLGIRNELKLSGALDRVRSILVLRHMRPEFILDARVCAQIESNFAGVIMCEESEALRRVAARLPRIPVLHTEPILIRNAEELGGEIAGLKEIHAGGGRRLVFAVGSGTEREQARLRAEYELLGREVRAESGWEFVQMSAGERHSHWPLMEMLPFASLVIGPAGYNLFHEVRALRKPAVWLPLQKKYDDQFWRARSRTAALERKDLLNLFTHSLAAVGDSGVQKIPAFQNGAEAAARFIMDALSGGAGLSSQG